MSRFRTTRWSLVKDASGAAPHASRALDELCRIYRPPVLAYVRGRGHAEIEAEDLTQAFFEQLLRLRTHATADRDRGRFRVFLQVALKRFLSNCHAATNAEKRGGGISPLSLDDEQRAAEAPPDPNTPEAEFERAFAHAVLRQALERLAAEAQVAGKEAQFELLREFLLEAPDPEDYARTAERLGWRRNTLAVTIHRLRQRLRDLVREALLDTVADAPSLDAEMTRMQAALTPR